MGDLNRDNCFSPVYHHFLWLQQLPLSLTMAMSKIRCPPLKKIQHSLVSTQRRIFMGFHRMIWMLFESVWHVIDSYQLLETHNERFHSHFLALHLLPTTWVLTLFELKRIFWMCLRLIFVMMHFLYDANSIPCICFASRGWPMVMGKGEKLCC